MTSRLLVSRSLAIASKRPSAAYCGRGNIIVGARQYRIVAREQVKVNARSGTEGRRLMASNIFSPNLFEAKSCVVTGGGSGIGLDVARQLLSLGARVVIASRDQEKCRLSAESLADECGLSKSESEAKIQYRQCDIRETEDVKRLASFCVSEFGRIDFLVNNGGGQFPAAAESITDKGWNAVIDTNLNGTFRMCREFFNTPGGFRDTGGSIVNVVCLHDRGFPSMSHTGAARAGVNNLTKTLAIEWAEFGVRVNAVAPGIIYSKSAEDNYKKGAGVFAKLLSEKAPQIPFRRLGSCREVSNTICFLLGQGGSYISGACLEVDGALSCAGSVGSDIFLRKPARSNAFPFEGELPYFCISNDDRVTLTTHAGQDVDAQIKELELKLESLRRRK